MDPCASRRNEATPFTWIGQQAPAFWINGKQVEVLHEPSQFYKVLKDEILKAKHRIVLASLYLGCSQLEQNLVDALRDSLCRSQSEGGHLQVQILLDCTRASRGGPANPFTSRSMLLPLVQEFGGAEGAGAAAGVREPRLSVALYHSPELRGWAKRLLPHRLNESVGLSHIKVYLFDDNLIISGANLSENYFVNRQDRYILFRSVRKIADFFHRIVNAVSSFSLQLQPDSRTKLHRQWSIHPFADECDRDGRLFKQTARERIDSVLDNPYLPHPIHDSQPPHTSPKPQPCSQPSSKPQSCSETYPEHAQLDPCTDPKHTQRNPSADLEHTQLVPCTDLEHTQRNPCTAHASRGECECDTLVYPLLQMPPFGIHVDESVTERLFCEAEPRSRVHLASGYFNLTERYRRSIVNQSRALFTVISSSPQCNGFYGARGLAGFIPDAYTYLTGCFLNEVSSQQQQDRVKLREYARRDWTFHGKGMWHYSPAASYPCFTLIGSSNFGYRSVHRDLESQVAVFTTNSTLQKKLHEEKENLIRHCEPTECETLKKADRRVALWVRLVTPLIRSFL